MARVATRLVLGALLLAPPSARAQPHSGLDDPSEAALARDVDCEPISMIRDGDALVVACAHRVVRIDVSTQRERDSGVSHDRIVRLERDRQGRVVAVTARRMRVPLAAEVPDAPAPERTDVAGEVSASARDEVTVRLSRPRSIEPGDALAFHVRSEAGERRVATGTVEQVDGDRATVRVGLGERAPAGAIALPTEALEHSLWAPPRVAGLVVLRAGIDGLIPLDGAGGALLTLDGAWHLDAPVVLRAGLAPLGLGARGGDGILAALGYVSAGLDLDAFSLSLGVAATTINQRPRGQATAAPAPMIGARIGAAEGFSGDVQLFFTVDDVGLDLGVGRARLTLPLSSGVRLVNRADVGRHGVLRVDIGLSIFALGRGDRGSLAIGAFAGVGHLYYQQVCPIGACPRVMVLSPSVGLEVDWRP